MTWDDLRHGPWPDTARIPADAPDAATAARLSLPPTVRPVPGAEQVPVFDPAMQHHGRALRPSEPRFRDPDDAARWFAARRRALDHVLAAVGGSRWAENLMLRGSMLLSAWYGSAARDPGDLDFVLRPETWGVTEARTDVLLHGVARAAEDVSRASGVLIHADGAVWSDIWTYDRVPGRRVVLPWDTEGLPGGTVQLDFVFNEHLPSEPEFTDVPRPDGSGAARVLAASPELSLAWKLLWLSSDIYPEGKDLYDACLLAEHTFVSADLLAKVFELADDSYKEEPIAEASLRESLTYVEWDEFRKDRPNIATTPQPYIDRLMEALRPTFDAL
ncbi:nucleotidyl transferase AbiEii/AbiGii toxin family protein [Actinomadura oligospora]|uniref:nucleotidyl transferase AbiEii/AbiGii toxin family protein n=1 Tax=Actinomadura oligospora TaxID=111804 RepID=UPI0004AF7091|nr:nucleotidyl transferase AbiEii/AbiGii toxin family protein [Actinomadura oligospora]